MLAEVCELNVLVKGAVLTRDVLLLRMGPPGRKEEKVEEGRALERLERLRAGTGVSTLEPLNSLQQMPPKPAGRPYTIFTLLNIFLYFIILIIKHLEIVSTEPNF